MSIEVAAVLEWFKARSGKDVWRSPSGNNDCIKVYPGFEHLMTGLVLHAGFRYFDTKLQRDEYEMRQDRDDYLQTQR